MENLVLYEDEKYFHIILGESVEKGWDRRSNKRNLLFKIFGILYWGK